MLIFAAACFGLAITLSFSFLRSLKRDIDTVAARGRADERAAIVRWLRAGGPAARDATRWPCDSFADEIERGDHER